MAGCKIPTEFLPYRNFREVPAQEGVKKVRCKGVHEHKVGSPNHLLDTDFLSSIIMDFKIRMAPFKETAGIPRSINCFEGIS